MNTMQTDNQWFIAREGQQHGPVSDVEIRKLAELGHLRAVGSRLAAGLYGLAAGRRGISARRPAQPAPAAGRSPLRAAARAARSRRRSPYAKTSRSTGRPAGVPATRNHRTAAAGSADGAAAAAQRPRAAAAVRGCREAPQSRKKNSCDGGTGLGDASAAARGSCLESAQHHRIGAERCDGIDR